MNKEYVVELIRAAQEEKKNNKQEPKYAIDVDLFNRVISDFKGLVNELVKDGVIGFDKTINNTAFYIKKK